MRSIRDRTIRQKLLVITLAPLAASLLVAGVGIVISDSILFRSAMQRDLAALASIVGDNSTAALAFDDPRVALETLTALTARPHMLSACIYKPNGTVFARYAPPGSARDCDPPSAKEEVRIAPLGMIASHPILLKDRPIGTLVMFYDLGEAQERTSLYIALVLVILLASTLIAFLLLSRLLQLITTPISRLALAATSVSRSGDYSVRVEKHGDDEIGILGDSFNEMLAQIQSRDVELQNARYSLQTTLNSIGDAVISTDLKRTIVFANPVAQSLLRLKEEELLGKDLNQVFRTLDELSRASVESPIDKVLRDRGMVEFADHMLLVAGDEAPFPIDESVAPIRNAAGEMTGVVLVFRDISNRRATEKLLEAQAAELRERSRLLKEADERKDQFLAMLAHELRNPMAPIRNAAQVLKRIGSADPNLRSVSEIIERQTQYLARLVEDLLDVSRITRGKVTLQNETLELSTIVNRAVETTRPLIDARKHHLFVSLPSAPIRLRGDLTRLVQVIGNLLNNAAKFTHNGGSIRLEAERIGAEVVIRVIDNGIGFPAEFAPHIFELFIQADRSLDRSEGGLGVGLTVAGNLVELHGGKIEARSRGSGQGSEFIVRLPAIEEAVQDNGHSETRDPQFATEKLRIVILEDNSDSADMLRLMLQLEGYDVTTAADGPRGMEAAAAVKPDVILCDIGLPGMTGYDVALQLRTKPEFKTTLLIALSGYGQEEDRRRSQQAGFDYHLAKPIEPSVLLDLLHSHGRS